MKCRPAESRITKTVLETYSKGNVITRARAIKTRIETL